MERLLITLLVRLGVIASVASFVARYLPFRRALLRETRTFEEQFHFALWFGGVFGVLATVRVVIGYEGVDLGLEGSFLAGLLGGYLPGLLAGILISIPCMAGSEYLTMPLFAGIGVMGGLLRDFVHDPEDIWRLSPFIDLNLWRALKNFKFFPLAFALAVCFSEFLRQLLGHIFPRRFIFLLYPAWDAPHGLSELALYLTTFLAITLPLKVWNNTRNETKLEQQKNLLMEARLQALTSQINPHFLFNTLNSVSSLIRTNPEQARVMILKLSRILRRLLRKHEHLSPLRDELDFIDDYLSIEQVRYGKLRFEKHIEPSALDVLVPSMLLQPLVENCIKHGLSGKVDGGTIVLRARRERSMLYVSVEDDGAGISRERLTTMMGSGIGVNNVSERLKVLFGDEGVMRIESEEGRGTRVEIQVPESPQGALAAV